MGRIPVCMIPVLLAAVVSIRTAGWEACAGLPPPPSCNPSAEICERLSWIEQVLWSNDKEAIPRLRAMATGDTHVRTRERSLGALVVLEDSGAPNVFFDRLASDPDPAVRRAAAEGIGILKFPGPPQLLTEPLQKDTHPLVRAECARALGRTRRLTAVPYLSFALLRDPSPPVRALSAEALASLRAPEATEPLLQGVRDEDPLVRLYAIRGLVDTDPSSASALFREVWETTNDQELRVEAFRGLILLEESVKWREAGLADQDERIRFMALQEWLAKLSRLSGRKSTPLPLAPGVLQRIEPFLSDKSRGIRELAKSFLEKQGFRIRPSGFIYVIQN